MEQKYIIKNNKSFIPRDIFECGQCFRWNIEKDKSYTGVFGNNVLNVKQENNDIIISGICDGDIEKVCIDYFDLNRDYEKIKETLSEIDENLRESSKYGAGIRILNQDLWETIISFIISANNNIPRIKGIINRLSQKYGKEIEFKGVKYYTFPTSKELGQASIEDLRSLGMGFRDKYIYGTTKMINDGTVSLEKLASIDDTKQIRDILLTFPGIGPKVADCILLFSTLNRYDVFPIDVWVRRVMNELYIHNEDEKKVSKREIEKIAIEKFGSLQGFAQQYLFYWRQNGRFF